MQKSPEASTPLGFLLFIFSLSILPRPFGQGEKVKPPKSLDNTGFLEVEASCLDGLVLLAG